MVGSSDSIAPANVVLNTIVAESFKEAADELEKADDFDMAVHDMIKKLLADHRRIIFNGNGYSDAWVEEAGRRGLPNITSMVDAIPDVPCYENSILQLTKLAIYATDSPRCSAFFKYSGSLDSKSAVSVLSCSSLSFKSSCMLASIASIIRQSE